MTEIILYEGITWQDLEIATEIPFSEVDDVEWEYYKGSDPVATWSDIQFFADADGNCITHKNTWLPADLAPAGSVKIQVKLYNSAGDFLYVKTVSVRIKEMGSL